MRLPDLPAPPRAAGAYRPVVIVGDMAFLSGFGPRDADGQPNQDAEGTAEIIIGKQRNGPVGTVKLAFIKEHTRFENLAHGAA